jgi:hypothetical protein
MHQISIIYFDTKLYVFRASSVPIIGSYQLYTWQLVCSMQVIWLLPRRVRLFQPDPPRKCTVINPDDGNRRCPKHVEFRDKINFGYLMHLVGYFIRRRSNDIYCKAFVLYKIIRLTLSILKTYRSKNLNQSSWNLTRYVFNCLPAWRWQLLYKPVIWQCLYVLPTSDKWNKYLTPQAQHKPSPIKLG